MTTTSADGFELRAGGTDLSERHRSGVSRAPARDIDATPQRGGISWANDGSARLGALTSVAMIAGDPKIAAAYPGIAAAAAGLATPQIRHLATLGGNLAQRSRCWYFRSPDVACLKKGGTDCPARGGNHLYGVAFDLGPCVAPHPSTLAAALMAYDAHIDTDRRAGLPVADVLGDGRNGRADNLLAAGEVIETIALPVPVPRERARYKRAIARTYAEWPLVELVARAVVENGRFQSLWLCAGGVAPVPLRLTAAEAAGRGASIDAAAIARIAEQSVAGANPLPQTGYKVALLHGLVQDLLEQIVVAGAPAGGNAGT
jgi:xanthine dehydrogenase YagS FAD-binding subunit